MAFKAAGVPRIQKGLSQLICCDSPFFIKGGKTHHLILFIQIGTEIAVSPVGKDYHDISLYSL